MSAREWFDLGVMVTDLMLLAGAVACMVVWARTKDVDFWRVAVLAMLWLIL